MPEAPKAFSGSKGLHRFPQPRPPGCSANFRWFASSHASNAIVPYSHVDRSGALLHPIAENEGTKPKHSVSTLVCRIIWIYTGGTANRNTSCLSD